jgi:hypothetical protein
MVGAHDHVANVGFRVNQMEGSIGSVRKRFTKIVGKIRTHNVSSISFEPKLDFVPSKSAGARSMRRRAQSRPEFYQSHVIGFYQGHVIEAIATMSG